MPAVVTTTRTRLRFSVKGENRKSSVNRVVLIWLVARTIYRCTHLAHALESGSMHFRGRLVFDYATFDVRPLHDRFTPGFGHATLDVGPCLFCKSDHDAFYIGNAMCDHALPPPTVALFFQPSWRCWHPQPTVPPNRLMLDWWRVSINTHIIKDCAIYTNCLPFPHFSAANGFMRRSTELEVELMR